MQHILIVEDDAELAQWTADYLISKGFTVSVCDHGDEAANAILESQPVAVILDGMLPGLDGLDVCKAVRHQYKGPILMLTARDEEIDEILGLEVGADDYLVKPVKPRILLARIKAALRRQHPSSIAQSDEECVSVGGLLITLSSRSVLLNEQEINVSTNEFDLLWLLAKQAGQVVERQYLVNELRGFEYDGFDRSIDLRISRLRKKLGDDSNEPFKIKTVWGRGYLMTKDAW